MCIGWDGKRGLSIQSYILFGKLSRLHCILDIVIPIFCQTKCCGTTVISGDKLVIASPLDLMLVFVTFHAVIHSQPVPVEEGFFQGGEKNAGTGQKASRPTFTVASSTPRNGTKWPATPSTSTG